MIGTYLGNEFKQLHSYSYVVLLPQDPSDSPFTQDEIIKYTKRKAEGYDITNDLGYNYWLSLQPGNDITSTCDEPTTRLLPPKKTILSSILKKAPSVHHPDIKPKSSARVVTSEECRKEINDKYLKKQEEARLKEMRALERQRKRVENEKNKSEGTKLRGILGMV